MSSLTLEGVVLNVLNVSARTAKDGTKYEGYAQVQIMCEDAQQNGEKRLNLHTFRIAEKAPFEERISQRIRIPVGVFVSGGVIVFFLPRGAQIIDT